jgi:uncharacterized lipoprotein YddW (UPF0748 family)
MMQNWRALFLAASLTVGLISSAPAASRRGELRGVWLSLKDTTDWAKLAQSLQGNGFNAVFLQAGDGWAARYPSDVLPVRLGDAEADTLAEAVAALQAHELECHAVGLGFATRGGEQELLESYRRAGRFQRSADGGIVGDQDAAVPAFHYLCPSHPDNRRLLREAAVELVQKYAVSGVQLAAGGFLVDPETCFCEGCRERFQSQTGVEVANWPGEVLQGGSHAAAWQQWRRDVVTSLGEEIAEAIQAQTPVAFVSLSDSLALSRLPNASRQGAELWREVRDAWVSGGVLDFVCPMLSGGSAQSASLLETYVAELRGRVPVYPVLYAGDMTSVWPLIERIEAVRAAGADGFVVGASSPQVLLNWLPDVRATVAAADPNPTPHGHPPARFAFGGEATAPPASGASVLAGATLEAELSVGWEPPAPSTEDTAGAEAAGAMLERALDVRDPIEAYEERGPVVAPQDEDRVSGRLIAEAPDGTPLSVLGAFDSSYQFARTLLFPAPSGRFRVAIYGTLKTGPAATDFVVRSPLLHGLTEDELTAASRLTEFEELRLYACDAPEFAVFEKFAPVVVHIKSTGPREASWWVRFDEDGCETGLGAPDDPDLTFTATVEDYLAAANGTISTDLLFDSGRLRVTGDEELLAQLADMFMGDQPAGQR